VLRKSLTRLADAVLRAPLPAGPVLRCGVEAMLVAMNIFALAATTSR